MRRNRFLAAAVLLPTLLLSACGSSAQPASPTQQQQSISPVTQDQHPVQNAKNTTAAAIKGVQQATKSTADSSSGIHVAKPPASKLVNATITRVVDGDTMHVSINGRDETIRLLCVDTPETVKPNTPVEPYGPQAHDFATQYLTGKQVQLEYDGPQRDKYDRLLVHLWVGNTLYNELILEKGLARIAYLYDPPYNHMDAYQAAEAKAKAAKLGIWSIPGYVTPDGFNLAAVKSSSTGSSSSAATGKASGSTSSSAAASGNHPEWAKALADLKKTGDVDCSDFTTHAAAQAFFEAHDPSADPYRLDGNHDDQVCTSLP